MARIPLLTAAGRRFHEALTAARSGGRGVAEAWPLCICYVRFVPIIAIITLEGKVSSVALDLMGGKEAMERTLANAERFIREREKRNKDG